MPRIYRFAHQDSAMLQYHKAGYSFRQIARKLGRTRSSISGRIYRLRQLEGKPQESYKPDHPKRTLLIHLGKKGFTIKEANRAGISTDWVHRTVHAGYLIKFKTNSFFLAEGESRCIYLTAGTPIVSQILSPSE